MVDVYADIVPGKGAAGFHLGQSIQSVTSAISDLRVWTGSEGGSFREVRGSTPGWLSSSPRKGRFGETLYFGRGMIRLQFNARGILYSMFLCDGYSGTLWGRIKIGSALSLVQELCPLEYDEGDEMHYPAEGSQVSGIAFVAEELPLAEAPDQVIACFSVHDWSMQ